MRMHPHAEGPMATLLLRSTRSSKVPQAAPSLAMPPEPPAEHAAAKDRHIHGSDGRHQVGPPCRRRRHPLRHLSRRRARPCCRHMEADMILSQPGAWSAEPSGLLPGPCNHCVLVPRITPLVLGEARESWRCPTGGAEHTRSSLLMVLMDDAPISTAAVASSRRRQDADAAP